MRTRFFITILTVLIFVSLAVIIIYGSLQQSERLAFIDQQVRDTASSLVDSELVDLRKLNLEQADDIISEELGESRIGKFFVFRNSKGEILFESSSAKVLPIREIPRSPRWVTLNTDESYIRVLNLDLPSIPDRTLQVGVVTSREIVHPNYFTTSTYLLLLSVLGVGLVASLILTSFLLKPISQLADFAIEASESLKSEQNLKKIPIQFGKGTFLDNSLFNQNDEYQKLIHGFNILIDRVNRFNRSTQLWTYQMAHELKTPLTLIRLESEIISQSPQIHSIQKELHKVSEIISSFLNWAELENSNKGQNLFANKLSQILKNTQLRLDPSQSRIHLFIENEVTLICNPIHIEHLIVNILTNSLKYTPVDRIINIYVENQSLKFCDYGSGISKDILNRIGEPFNKASSSDGSGLGLAWVSSICKHYSWNLEITSTENGVTVLIDFENSFNA